MKQFIKKLKSLFTITPDVEECEVRLDEETARNIDKLLGY